MYQVLCLDSKGRLWLLRWLLSCKYRLDTWQLRNIACSGNVCRIHSEAVGLMNKAKMLQWNNIQRALYKLTMFAGNANNPPVAVLRLHFRNRH